MSLRDQLQAIYEEHGRLDKTLVVELATPEDHPLHDYFDWNDATAAHAHRLEQARRLIVSMRVTFKRPNGKPDTIRSWHAAHWEDRPDTSYRPVDEIIDDPIATRVLIAEMKREWLSLKRRYDRFNEFWQMLRDDIEGAA